MEQKYITLILLKMKKVTFRVFGQFRYISGVREQHKCDLQMNNTRGLQWHEGE